MNKIILVATLPIATSANSSYKSNGRGGKVLSADALEYTAKTLSILKYPNGIHGGLPPYKVHHLDMATIEEIRSLRLNKSRSKKVMDMHRYYKIEEELFFNNWNNDLDNPHKLEQDVISAWIGFNDNRVVEIHSKKIVIAGCQPHMDIKVIQCDPIVRSSGSLAWEAMTTLDLPKMYSQPYYDDNGEIDADSSEILGRRETNSM